MTINDLEPCQFFNVGMHVWVLKLHEGKPFYTPAKVVEAHGYSAYVEGKFFEGWTDLRFDDVMIQKRKRQNELQS